MSDLKEVSRPLVKGFFCAASFPTGLTRLPSLSPAAYPPLITALPSSSSSAASSTGADADSTPSSSAAASTTTTSTTSAADQAVVAPGLSKNARLLFFVLEAVACLYGFENLMI